jgi:hypothetical protein
MRKEGLLAEFTALPPACAGVGFPPVRSISCGDHSFNPRNIIVLGHPGITGDDNTCWPSPRQISAADNVIFLDNGIAYLARGQLNHQA